MYELAIFAGGLGSRLNKTELKPKPFVDINGKSLIARIISSFNYSGIFSSYHILTCCDDDNYSYIIKNELPDLDINIYNEPKRSGRTGALKYFLEQNNFINKFFVANGDTIFSNVCASELKKGIEMNQGDLPITFLANPDPTRDDYLAFTNTNSKKLKNLQNSGLFYVSRRWLEEFVFITKNLKDIDHYLFSIKPPSISIQLSTFLYDGGTPDRLKKIRELIK